MQPCKQLEQSRRHVTHLQLRLPLQRKSEQCVDVLQLQESNPRLGRQVLIKEDQNGQEQSRFLMTRLAALGGRASELRRAKSGSRRGDGTTVCVCMACGRERRRHTERHGKTAAICSTRTVQSPCFKETWVQLPGAGDGTPPLSKPGNMRRSSHPMCTQRLRAWVRCRGRKLTSNRQHAGSECAQVAALR